MFANIPPTDDSFNLAVIWSEIRPSDDLVPVEFGVRIMDCKVNRYLICVD